MPAALAYTPANPLSQIASNGKELAEQTSAFVEKWRVFIPVDQREEFSQDYSRTLASLSVCLEMARRYPPKKRGSE